MLRKFSVAAANALLAAILLVLPPAAAAQRHGGVNTAGGGGLSGGNGRPDGVDEKDSLKDFHRALAVQATTEQIAEFREILKQTDSAKSELESFEQERKAKAESTPTGENAKLDQVLESARKATRKFVDGFSIAQKSGLREDIRRLDKADSDLQQEETRLDQILKAPNPVPSDFAPRTEALDKTLADFSAQQVALGAVMGIVLANAQDVSFNLPGVKDPVKIGNQTVEVIVSGLLSQTSVQGTQRTFKLEMNTDLTDFQQNITQILRSQIEQGSQCGERLGLRRATIETSAPVGMLTLQLHYERWSCTRMFGQATSSELAESDADIEVKLTPAVDASNVLKLTPEFTKIGDNGMFGESLRSGSLGDDLREKISETMLIAMRAGTDFKTILPSAVRSSAVVQSARFQPVGAGTLNLIIEGQVQISGEQANQLASQLNQTLAAQGSAQP